MRSILACPNLHGISLSPVNIPARFRPSPTSLDFDPTIGHKPDFVSTSLSSSPPPLKLLSYADDLEVFLNNTGEWYTLLGILKRYSYASNAKVNLNKTVLVSLSGQRLVPWITIAETEGVEWQDETSSGYVRYLGYPLYHSPNQLQVYLDELKVKLCD